MRLLFLAAAAAALSLAACEPIEDTRTEGEKLFSRDLSTSYSCSIDQWENVKRRIEVCEVQGWGSKPFEGCPSQAIRSECTYKGDTHNNLTSPN